MLVTLIEMEEALARLSAGELAYEYMTTDPQLRLLGPACPFGPTILQGYRQDGLYAENLEEATEMAGRKGAEVTGIWFIKHPPAR
jgi:hypothetical protein